ncbi:hypothetical protein FA95DRAFT_864290 [Auriscalpium vulgare]|uniref:Uncharacterized protein n=1 Tax=Auriscalpium vulgare TaxID=40419 RepID=A0ACB8S0C2_9AGAM|nr:hypothetical protein FA95DRAFT_864290 [Auriscalpium vulgare]
MLKATRNPSQGMERHVCARLKSPGRLYCIMSWPLPTHRPTSEGLGNLHATCSTLASTVARPENPRRHAVNATHSSFSLPSVFHKKTLSRSRRRTPDPRAAGAEMSSFFTFFVCFFMALCSCALSFASRCCM